MAQSSGSDVPTQNKSSVIEEKIIDTIFKLKEFRQRAAYVEKQTKGKRHLEIVIYRRPSKDIPYYWIKAREYNGMSYATHFNFYVYPKPFTIRFYDSVRDTGISLKEWRFKLKVKRAVHNNCLLQNRLNCKHETIEYFVTENKSTKVLPIPLLLQAV